MADSTMTWSAQFTVAQAKNIKLTGDKIILPQSALEGLLAAAPVVKVDDPQFRTSLSGQFDPFNPYSVAEAQAQARLHEALAERQQQLPHPLTFRLVNPVNGQAVYAGIREFSADENEIYLSAFLQDALGLKNGTTSSSPSHDDDGKRGRPTITVHARQLPKGTYVRIRPLEAGYDAEDWKALLERYLRGNFTTLTINQVLDVPGPKNEHFRFLVDKFEPESESGGVCVVDTDLEVDIEPLSEEQARETLNRRLEKARRAPGTNEGSSVGGLLNLGKEVHGQVVPGEYVDYQLADWTKCPDVEVEMVSIDSELLVSADVFVSPISAQQQAKPRADEHVLGDMSSRPTKRIRLTHQELDPSADTLAISVHAWRGEEEEKKESRLVPISYRLVVTQQQGQEQKQAEQSTSTASNEVLCKNCHQAIPKGTLALHEAFCYRNNVSCPKCQTVFLKSSEAWKTHWHCDRDDDYGSGELSKIKHNENFHPASPFICGRGECTFSAFDQAILAQHRTSTCPAKEIICRFCHLLVPQQGPDDRAFDDAEVLLSGLTPHELSDGARTTECAVCGRFVRLRDMNTHLGLHDRDRRARPRPRICANPICARTIAGAGAGAGAAGDPQQQQLGLCNECFGPLYGSTHDPEGKALRRRIERRLLQQLMVGCGQAWCRNVEWCRTGQSNAGTGAGATATTTTATMTARDALPLIKPVLDRLKAGDSGALLHFCVDQNTQTRRVLANAMAGRSSNHHDGHDGHDGQDKNGQDKGEYEVEWCIKALEEIKNDVGRAYDWLRMHAPRRDEA